MAARHSHVCDELLEAMVGDGLQVGERVPAVLLYNASAYFDSECSLRKSPTVSGML